MSTPPESSDAELTYEQARDELTRLVQRLESGGAPLDESLALWERGERLATICQQWLDGAKAKIDAARTQTPQAHTSQARTPQAHTSQD